jgi:hypothetical protein
MRERLQWKHLVMKGCVLSRGGLQRQLLLQRLHRKEQDKPFKSTEPFWSRLQQRLLQSRLRKLHG